MDHSTWLSPYEKKTHDRLVATRVRGRWIFCKTDVTEAIHPSGWVKVLCEGLRCADGKFDWRAWERHCFEACICNGHDWDGCFKREEISWPEESETPERSWVKGRWTTKCWAWFLEHFLSWWDDNSRKELWCDSPLDAVVLWKWRWKNMCSINQTHTHTQERLPPRKITCVLTCHVPWNFMVSRCIFLLKPVPFQGTLIIVRGSIFVVFQASQELSFTFSQSDSPFTSRIPHPKEGLRADHDGLQGGCVIFVLGLMSSRMMMCFFLPFPLFQPMVFWWVGLTVKVCLWLKFGVKLAFLLPPVRSWILIG